MLINQGFVLTVRTVRLYEGGMFIATNEAERTIGLKAFRNQFKSMEQTITNIEQADLKNWEETIKIAN